MTQNMNLSDFSTYYKDEIQMIQNKRALFIKGFVLQGICISLFSIVLNFIFSYFMNASFCVLNLFVSSLVSFIISFSSHVFIYRNIEKRYKNLPFYSKIYAKIFEKKNILIHMLENENFQFNLLHHVKHFIEHIEPEKYNHMQLTNLHNYYVNLEKFLIQGKYEYALKEFRHIQARYLEGTNQKTLAFREKMQQYISTQYENNDVSVKFKEHI